MPIINNVLQGGTHYHGVSNLPISSGDFTAGITVTDAPATGKKLMLSEAVISCNTANAVTLKETTTGTILAGPFYLAANAIFHFKPLAAWQCSSANQAISAFTTTTGNCMVDIAYFSQA
jgi:hypothetical protein